MTGLGLVILAAVVAVLTQPTGVEATVTGRYPNVDGSLRSFVIVAFIAWAVVCVAMVAGLVTWAVLR